MPNRNIQFWWIHFAVCAAQGHNESLAQSNRWIIWQNSCNVRICIPPHWEAIPQPGIRQYNALIPKEMIDENYIYGGPKSINNRWGIINNSVSQQTTYTYTYTQTYIRSRRVIYLYTFAHKIIRHIRITFESIHTYGRCLEENVLSFPLPCRELKWQTSLVNHVVFQ